MEYQPHIDLSNYEVFVIDYLDGQLSGEEEVALLAFLEKHPELKEEVDGLELATLEPLEISSDLKQSLKKTPICEVHGIDENNYESYFIAFAEKDLNETKIQQLEKFLLANPLLFNEFELHKNLRLRADQTIVYPDKEGLKKRRILPVVWISGVAATLTLLLAVSFFLQNNKPNTSRQIVNIPTFATIPENLILEQDLDMYAILPEREAPTPTNFVAQTEENPATVLSAHEKQLFAYSEIKIQRLPQKPINTALFNLYDFHRLEAKEFPSPEDTFEFLMADASTEPIKKKSLFSKIVGGQLAKIGDRFGRNKEQNINRQLEKSEPGYIKVIDRSILVFNTITGSETNVSKTYNNDGHLTDYSVAGNTLYVSRPIESTQRP